MEENLPIGAIPEDQFETYEEKYGTPSEQAKLFGVKAAEAATFGLSTKLLAEQGLLDIEAQRAREEVSPGTALAGEVTGIAGSLLVPASPVGAVARGAERVTRLAEPGVAKIVSKIANPETAARVNKILTKAGSAAIGSALEGGVYGVGTSITEDALGESSLNAESLLTNIGIGSLYGGLAGGAVGGLMGAIQKPIPKVIKTEKDLVAATGAELGNTYVDLVSSTGLPEKEKEKLLAGLAKLKPNVQEIDDAAKRLGVDVLVGQRANDESIQKIYSILGDSISPFGVQERQKVQTAIGTIKQKFADALGGATKFSKAMLGEGVSESIAGKFEAIYKPIKELYEIAENKFGKINLTDDEKIEIMESIERFIRKEQFIPQGEAEAFARKVQNGLVNFKTYRDIDGFAKAITKEAPYEIKWVAQGLRNEIEDTMSDILFKFADGVQAQDVTGEIATALASAKAAKPLYKKLITDMQQMGKVLGNAKIKGPADFIEFITQRQTPEKIVDKLFQKQNSRFLKKFQKDFPEEWSLIRNYQKGLMFEKALDDGAVNPNKVIRIIDKMEPELKSALFTKQELQTIKDSKTYLEALPEKFNTSNTAVYTAWQSFFEDPIKAGLTTLRDVGFKGMFKALNLTAKEEQQLKMLQKIEKAKIQTEVKIKSGVKSVFQVADKVIKAEITNTDKDDQKIKEDLEKYSADPELFINEMEARTQNLYDNAPKIAGSFHETATRATVFLASKLPKVPPKKPLGMTYQLSKADVAKFNRYLDAINNPTSLLKQIETGNLNQDYVEAVKTVYPALYGKMQNDVIEELVSVDQDTIKKMPYRVKMGLSMLLGTDLANGLSAQSILANQPKLNEPKGVNQGSIRPTQGGIGKIKLASLALTPMQKASQDKES
jgi:hypothetical protein